MTIKVRAVKDGYRNNRIIKPGMGRESEFVIDSFQEFSRGYKEASKRGVGRKHGGWMEIIGISKDHKEADPEQQRQLNAHMKAVKEAKPVEEEFTDADEFESVDDIIEDEIIDETSEEELPEEESPEEIESSQEGLGNDTISDESEEEAI